jgi:hypothetical protein
MDERSEDRVGAADAKIIETPYKGWSTDQLCKIAILVLLGLNLNGELGALPL